MAHISPTATMQYAQQQARPVNGTIQQPPPQPQQGKSVGQMLTVQNEAVWLKLGNLSEAMGESDGAMQSYERALRFNHNSVPAMMAISSILRSRDSFPAAVDYLRHIIRIESENGEVWASLGHCYLMMDDLQQAYSAYQQALYHLRNPKEPRLWYGIGILYDRYGSLEHAEEAFSQVMRMEPNFEKANEIYFRLGIIYKQQQKYQQSLECFRYIVKDPPRPLSEEDIWFQVGHVHEQQKDYDAAKSAYKRVLDRDPNHAKVLQQLGWLHHQQSTSFSSQEQAIEYLEKSVSSDQTDAQSWYLLGRCYMSQQKYPKAYEAYQQAVYRDGRNPTFWCSIGVLYYQINQYRDALDAYSRAIRLNPNISEVWYDLGTLYESCSNQTTDALDAYTRAADLDPQNTHIKARLALLKGQPTNGMAAAPTPQDVHPQAYQPGAMGGPAPTLWGGSAATQAPSGPAPPPLAGGGGEWNRRLADIQGPSSQAQALNPYDQRDRLAHHTAQRPRSPPSHAHGYEGQRQPPPSHRGLSPSAKSAYTGTGDFPPGHYAQHAQMSHARAPGSSHHSRHGDQPFNGQNGGQGSHMGAPPPPMQAQSMTPYSARGPSPAQRDARPYPEHTPSRPSSRTSYRHPNVPHYARDGPPLQRPRSTEPIRERERHREREGDREREARAAMANQSKRMREWEDDKSSHKKLASEESRHRLSDVNSRRSSPPDHPSSKHTSPNGRPAQASRRGTPMQERPAKQESNESLPPMQSNIKHSPKSERASPTAPQQEEPSRASTPAAARKESLEDVLPTAPEQVLEPAARKMDVDEDYGDSGDDEPAETIAQPPAVHEEAEKRSDSAGKAEVTAPSAEVQSDTADVEMKTVEQETTAQAPAVPTES